MMPSEIYGTLYNQHDLNTVKDIYAKKPEEANPQWLQEEQLSPLLFYQGSQWY